MSVAFRQQMFCAVAVVAIAYIFLDSSQLHDSLIDSPFRDQAVDSNLAGLSQTVSSVHRLSVI